VRQVAEASESLVYRSDEAIPPGATIEEWLQRVDMTQTQLARRMDLSTKHVSQLVRGAVPLTPEVALSLDRVTGVPARVWNRLEVSFREQTLREEEEQELAKEADWLAEFPWKELVKRGAVEDCKSPAERVRRLLAFFGVANRASYERVWDSGTAFRKARSHPSNAHALAAWLRIGEIRAEAIRCKPYDKALFRQALTNARVLTRDLDHKSWLPKLQAICADAGVVVLVEKEMSGCRVNGAARWLAPTKALVQLSFRYRWYDVFWFTFFHEAGHLLRHSKKVTFADDRNDAKEQESQSFVDDGTLDERLEREADDFARRTLIPAEYEAELQRLKTEGEITEFARRVGVAPGVVLGRLQFEERLPYSAFYQLKKRFSFDD